LRIPSRTVEVPIRALYDPDGPATIWATHPECGVPLAREGVYRDWLWI